MRVSSGITLHCTAWDRIDKDNEIDAYLFIIAAAMNS
jgi:hypothetical protein